MPGEECHDKLEELCFTPLKREICLKAGLEPAFHELASFGAFLKSILVARKMSGSALAEKARVDKALISRLLSDDAIPRVIAGRKCGDERYERIADALGLDRELFIQLVVSEQKRFYSRPYEVPENIDALVREHRIRLSRLIKLAPLEDPGEETRCEEVIEKLLTDFAKRVVAEMGNK